jgi:diaminohydroxyphosphoribosylaminopyrimidine deaminase/5-amino-6-(5-phosphoribosylamino)uracil reductase
MTEADSHWMRRALELAERGRGFVEPNPLVGAVVVRHGKIAGEGWHQHFGAAHAEVNALAQAATEACGATVYVTLEPCCHHAKTPPCTDALLRAGVHRVVAAMSDPFPQVAGRGGDILRLAGLAFDLGVEEAAARRLNAPYLKLVSTGRPYVHAKWAMTLDGKIAARTGDSKWISGEGSRRLVHELRGRMDALIVGIGTALADDPLLTVRPPGPRTPTRIVLDRKGRLPSSSRLAQTAHAVPTLIVTAEEAPAVLAASGCEVICLPRNDPDASVELLLAELGRRRMTNVLVEGGAAVFGSFLDACAIDEVHVFLAPILMGGEKALTAVSGRGVDRIAEALRLAQWEIKPVEGEVYVHGWK